MNVNEAKMEENAKAKTATRVKETRQSQSQDAIPKKVNKHQGVMKNDLPQGLPPPPPLPPQPFDGSSSIKKLFSEANKIMKIGMEKEYALLERETTLQNSNETIDNLRKNILHLQMEYEKLDQNFQREVSYRTEVAKRMDATRELVESAVQCSNVLSASLKQLEQDKLKIAEFYELIYQKQKETEAKHIQTEKYIKAQDELLKTRMDEINKFQCKIMSQKTDMISQLSKKLTQANDRLKTVTNENENLQQKIQDLQESSARLQTFLEQQQKVNCLHQENVNQFKQNLKKLKIQGFKHQKLLKNKKKQLCAVVSKNKNLKKALEKTELANRELLDSKENEWRNHLEEVVGERETWEAQKQELMKKLTDKQTEIEGLKQESEHFNSRILELTINEGAKRKELEQVQNDLSRMLSENLKLKEDVAKITEESNHKGKMITELELKSGSVNADLSSQLELYKKECEGLKDVVKRLESQLSDVQKRISYERTQKEQTISDLNRKLEDSLQISNKKTSDLEKLLKEKAAYIEKLESEQNQTTLSSKTALEKLDKELLSEKSKNKELNNVVGNLKESYNSVNKQLDEAKKQISDFEEKLTDLNSINKTLNRNRVELERNSDDLKKEIQTEKKLFEALEEKHKKAEKELSKMEKMAEENSSLKSTTAELKSLLEATEVRLEAYKAAVKKLESEKTDARNSHSEEVSKLKLELEAMKKEKFRSATPQKSAENTQQGKKEPGTPVTRAREKPSSSRLLNTKENEPEVVDIDKWQQLSSSPIQSGKKFLSTPRKIFTSTPQSSFRTVTPVQKKRDPYEFDSDSSVERFDQDKVLRVFNRQKRETANKRSKTTK